MCVAVLGLYELYWVASGKAFGIKLEPNGFMDNAAVATPTCLHQNIGCVEFLHSFFSLLNFLCTTAAQNVM